MNNVPPSFWDWGVSEQGDAHVAAAAPPNFREIPKRRSGGSVRVLS